jgi:hypothetical protein
MIFNMADSGVVARLRAANTIFITAAAMVMATPTAAAPKLKPDELLQAKNYVLAACLINRYPNTPLANEAEAWAGGLVEFGNFPAAAYVAMAKLVQTAPPPGLAQQGLVMKLQNCVDFSNSKTVMVQLEKILAR